jgi:hypothetical protein
LEADYNAGRTHPDKTGRHATIIVPDMMEEPDDLGPHMWNHHRAVIVALDTTMVPDDLDLHVTRNHRGITIVLDIEAEVDDPGPQRAYDHSRERVTRNTITQERVNRSRYEWDEHNYDDKENPMEAACFTYRVHRMQVPKGFKLPHDQQKYDGSQEPESWLSDYL